MDNLYQYLNKDTGEMRVPPDVYSYILELWEDSKNLLINLEAEPKTFLGYKIMKDDE